MNNKHLKLLILVTLFTQPIILPFNIKNIFSSTKYQEEILNKEFELSGKGNNKVEIKNLNGNISIKTWKQKKVLISAIREGNKDVDIDTRKYENTIDIITKNKPENKVTVNYNLMVPINTNIKVIMQNGSFKAKNIEGKIYLKLNYGNVDIQEAINSTYINVLNSGSIKLQYNKVLPGITTTLRTAKGDITLNLPNEVNTSLEAKTENGTTMSEHYVTLSPQTTKMNAQTWAKFKKEIKGTIGNNKSQIQLNTKNGNIKIIE